MQLPPTPAKEATALDPQWPAIARVLNREAQPLDDGGQPTPADLQVLLSHLERDDLAPNESLRAATHLTRLFEISTDHRWLQSVVAARLEAFIERVDDQWYTAASARPVIVKARAFLDAHSHQYVSFAEHLTGGAVLGMLATPAHMDEPVMTIKAPDSPTAVPAVRRKEVTPERIEEIKRDAAIMVMISPLLGAAEIGRLLEVFAGFPIGVLEGAWDSAKDLVAAGISNIKELGSLIGSIFTGEFRSKLWELGKKIWHFITSLPDLASALGEWFAHEWQSRSYFGKGRLLGEIVGYIAFTIAIGVLTEGASLEGEGGPLKQAAMKLLKVVDKAANPFTYVKPIAKVAAAIPGVKAVGEVAAKVAAPIDRIAAPIKRIAGAPGRVARRAVSKLLGREGTAAELVEDAEALAGREHHVPSMTEIEAAPAKAPPAKPRIGNEAHDLTPVAVDGELWLRLCSKKCGPLLEKLQAVRKAIEGRGSEELKTKLDALIERSDALQAEWAGLSEEAAESRLRDLSSDLEGLAADEPAVAKAIADGDVGPIVSTQPLQRRKGWVGEYGEQKQVIGDGSVHRDHQPSKAALKEAARREIDRLFQTGEIFERPNPDQLAEIYARVEREGLSVVVDREIHRAGPTYSGRNTPAQIAADAGDLASAARRDADAMVKNAQALDPAHLVDYRAAAEIIEKQTHVGMVARLRGVILDVLK